MDAQNLWLVRWRRESILLYFALKKEKKKKLSVNLVFKIQVLNAEVDSEFFSLLLQCVSKNTAKNLAETFVNYIGNGCGIPWHFAKGYDLVF